MNLTGARESDGGILLDRLLPTALALVLLVAMLAAIFVLDRRTELTPYQHLTTFPSSWPACGWVTEEASALR